MGFTSDACRCLLLKSLLIKNNRKREAALEKEAGRRGRETCFFFTWPKSISLLIYAAIKRLLRIF